MSQVQLTKMQNQMGLSPRLIGNFNCMLIVEILLFMSTTVIILVEKYKRVEIPAKKWFASLTISIVWFNNLNFGFGIAMEINHFA